jgi:uncharacterized phage infection (PIP) family protein YhgE
MTRHLGTTITSALALTLSVAGCSTPQRSADSTELGEAQTASALNRRTNGKVPGIDRSAEAVNSVRDLRGALTNERLQVDRTLAALTAVTNGSGDLTPAFQQYVQALTDLKASRQQTSSAADNMRETARGYISGWEVEVYGVDDPTLREQAERRRDAVRQDYSGVADNLRQVQSAHEKFESRADDLRRFLANDLTSAGVQAAGSAGQQAVSAGGELKGRIDATVSNLDAILGRMAPVAPVNRTANPAGNAPANTPAGDATGSPVQGVTPRGEGEPNKP